MADLRWVTRKGKKALLLDFTQRAGVAGEELARELQQITTAQPRASVLVLADFTGVNFSDNASKQIASAAAVDRPHVLRTARVAPRRGLTEFRDYSPVRHPPYTLFRFLHTPTKHSPDYGQPPTTHSVNKGVKSRARQRFSENGKEMKGGATLLNNLHRNLAKEISPHAYTAGCASGTHRCQPCHTFSRAIHLRCR